MIAIILIGGRGTRLRPFTLDTPKPLLPVVNRPFLEYQFDVLKSHGIREIVLCTFYRPETFRGVLGDGRRHGLRLRYVHEIHPLGTAGAVKNAESLLGSPKTVLVLNGDILNVLDVTRFVQFHRKNRADASIALTRVKDPTLYGLVETDEAGRVKKFLEKPSWEEIHANTVNAGAYLFEPNVLRAIPAKVNHSLERSLFPQLLLQGARLFGFVTGGYWIDIGTIDKYLQVHVDILRGVTPFALPGGARRRGSGIYLGKGAALGRELTLDRDGGRIVLGDGSRVADFVRLAGPLSIGPRCVIGKGATLENCVILEGAAVGEGAALKGCVVGAGCRIGANAALSDRTALAGGSRIAPYSVL